MAARKLNWGILSTGIIAHTFADAIRASSTGKLLAIASRDKATADAFGKRHRVARRYASYQALLNDADIDVVYIATPHPMHAEWAIKAAEAGKHILLEKPFTLNHAEAMAVIEATHKHNVFIMEAFAYRCHPQTAAWLDVIRRGVIGDIQLIDAPFSFSIPFDPSHRLIAHELGGGGVLDVGCYAASLARLVAGAAIGKPFDDPISVNGAGHINASTRTDEISAVTLQFASGILARVTAGVQVAQSRVAKIYGTEGMIELPVPYGPGIGVQPSKFSVQLHNRKRAQTITTTPDADLYVLEADHVANCIRNGWRQSPVMSWDDTLGNMRALDQWRAAIGLTYDMEKADAPQMQFTAANRPLTYRPIHHNSDTRMRYAHINGVDKPISRLLMGCDNQREIAHASVMFDDFVERGGNAFDTAWIYGGGLMERLVGQWLKNRDRSGGLREHVVILGKGAHTPHCNPEAITRQLSESLERLGTSYVDIYMMHRDNPDIPVGEFVDVLNQHHAAGRIHAFGASNWSLSRVQAANDYARKKGLISFSAISNNFSLARMVQPPWTGCISAADAKSRAWLTQRQMPLLSWSSQARGFFVRGNPDFHDDPEMERCWYAPDNFERLARAQQLAQQYGVPTISIALAYVLSQPFPTFALIGPRLLSETRTSLQGLDVELTADEVRWLNLE